MADVSALHLLGTILGAILAAAIASAVGYIKKTPLQEWDPVKFTRTVFWGVALVIAGLALNVPVSAPDIIEGKLIETGLYAAVVYFVDAATLLLYRKVLAPLLARIRAASAGSA